MYDKEERARLLSFEANRVVEYVNNGFMSVNEAREEWAMRMQELDTYPFGYVPECSPLVPCNHSSHRKATVVNEDPFGNLPSVTAAPVWRYEAKIATVVAAPKPALSLDAEYSQMRELWVKTGDTDYLELMTECVYLE